VGRFSTWGWFCSAAARSWGVVGLDAEHVLEDLGGAPVIMRQVRPSLEGPAIARMAAGLRVNACTESAKYAPTYGPSAPVQSSKAIEPLPLASALRFTATVEQFHRRGGDRNECFGVDRIGAASGAGLNEEFR
jgi:hypothetical protein